MLRLFVPALLLALTDGVTAPPDVAEPLPIASYGTPVAFGEWVWLDEPDLAISPQNLLTDSRCPSNARCIWAGEVRMTVRLAQDPDNGVLHPHGNAMTIDTQLGDTELGSAEGIAISDGQIEVEWIGPRAASTRETIELQDYRIVFSFTPNETTN